MGLVGLVGLVGLMGQKNWTEYGTGKYHGGHFKLVEPSLTSLTVD